MTGFSCVIVNSVVSVWPVTICTSRSYPNTNCVESSEKARNASVTPSCRVRALWPRIKSHIRRAPSFPALSMNFPVGEIAIAVIPAVWPVRTFIIEASDVRQRQIVLSVDAEMR